ncbi:MAG: aspartate aminotransferase family protein [Bdellovibrionales bacterium]|nr:aspartate aminotransferase family protein [Bdellovibrionales bacterium]
MSFNIKEIIQSRSGQNYDLHDTYINPSFSKVLKIIGFDRFYSKGKGAYLYDTQGHEYLDFICGYGVFNLGRNHPVINKAIKELLDLDYPNLVKMDAPLLSGLLAEALVKKMPRGIDSVFFANSGAEGVEAALKFARASKKKNKIIYTAHGYHGLTYGALSANGDSHFKEGFGELLDGFVQVPYNDLNALEYELSKKDVAGFIVEPIQGKGLAVPEGDYLLQAQNLCRKHDAHFIVDEVQTGMGRTGKFLALEHWNLEPDIVILSKSLSGGLIPVSAMLGRRDIFNQTFSRLDRCVVHSSTFSQNALAMCAGLAALHVLETEKMAENAEKLGSYLVGELNARKSRFELLKEVRGRGLYLGVEFGPPKSLKLKIGWNLLHKADQGLFSQAIIMPLLDKHKILTQVAGHNMDTIKLSPALCITEKDVNRFLLAFDDVMEACHRFPGPVWEIGTRLARHALKKNAHLSIEQQEFQN